jgi:protein phosphatase
MITHHGQTDVGKRRTLNEDAIFAGDGLFVVCDGMGGAPAGEVASEMAIQAIARELKDQTDGDELESSPFLPHTQRLVDAVRQ